MNPQGRDAHRPLLARRETDVPDNTFSCPSCGSDISASAKFCSECGHRITESPDVAASVDPATESTGPDAGSPGAPGTAAAESERLVQAAEEAREAEAAERERVVQAAADARKADEATAPPQPAAAPAPATQPQPATAASSDKGPAGIHWKTMTSWQRWGVVGASVLLLIVIGIAGGSSDESGGDDSEDAEQAAEVTSEPEPKPELVLTVGSPRDGATIKAPEAVLKGRVDVAGAKVRVKGKRVKLDGKRFTTTVPLKLGRNAIPVVASRAGYESATAVHVLRRKHSAAELAAIAEQKRIEAEQRKQTFMASATTIPYNQLEKNPYAHIGKRVTYYGQIFQIQESYGSGFMLLSVTDMGYDIWDDNIWVNYEGSVEGAEGDMLTVYGILKGAKSYETQIGGETYVPKMKARYIVE